MALQHSHNVTHKRPISGAGKVRETIKPIAVSLITAAAPRTTATAGHYRHCRKVELFLPMRYLLLIRVAGLEMVVCFGTINCESLRNIAKHCESTFEDLRERLRKLAKSYLRKLAKPKYFCESIFAKAWENTCILHLRKLAKTRFAKVCERCILIDREFINAQR